MRDACVGWMLAGHLLRDLRESCAAVYQQHTSNVERRALPASSSPAWPSCCATTSSINDGSAASSAHSPSPTPRGHAVFVLSQPDCPSGVPPPSNAQSDSPSSPASTFSLRLRENFIRSQHAAGVVRLVHSPAPVSACLLPMIAQRGFTHTHSFPQWRGGRGYDR